MNWLNQICSWIDEKTVLSASIYSSGGETMAPAHTHIYNLSHLTDKCCMEKKAFATEQCYSLQRTLFLPAGPYGFAKAAFGICSNFTT